MIRIVHSGSGSCFFCFFFFWRARVCRPLLCLCRPFMIFEGCLDSNPEYCRSKLARYRLSHPSLYRDGWLSLEGSWFFIPIQDPGSSGQKGTGSRIRNTGKKELLRHRWQWLVKKTLEILIQQVLNIFTMFQAKAFMWGSGSESSDPQFLGKPCSRHYPWSILKKS